MAKGKRIAMVSLGCAKNQVNSEQMLWQLRDAGYELSADSTAVDALVINTCGFIESAKSEAIDCILEYAQLKSEGEIGKIIVTGCLAERYKSEIKMELPEIDALVGCGSFNEIVKAVETAIQGDYTEYFGELNAALPESRRILSTGPGWAYLKIAEGCDNNCAYCIIPQLRGRYRSRQMENIVSEAVWLSENAVKELIIVAQDTSRYGEDLYGKRVLPDLLRKLSAIEGIEWIRLHYLYPDEVDEALIDEVKKNNKIIKYLDIPIQHISDKILASMNRRYTGADIRMLFEKLRAEIPGVVLRTSLITGLPGEGEAEFEELCEFLEEAKIERAGVFPYSPEEGTAAYHAERPERETAEHRAELAAGIQERIMDKYNNRRMGTEIEVLIEGYDSLLKMWYGRSKAESPEIDGKIFFSGNGLIAGELVSVQITDELDGELLGHQSYQTQ